MMVIDNKFSIGECVYLKTDVEQNMRLVIEIAVMPGGLVWYKLCLGTEVTEHYDFEISAEVNELIKVK